ncbi:MAG: DUF2179 domain-containing protein [Dehalococcoidia bacterium]|nr:DUF2179 domain-containing protein [Dehalococcoidia bacterium]MCA9844146.1 DUF2179 domain-containing protein [Dehalococcoidia bacterium]
MELSEFLTVGGAALLLFAIRIFGTALGTIRTLVMYRGHEVWTAVLGFGEIFVYVVGLGAVVNDLSNVAMLMGYCLGFSVGTIAGMRLDRRLAMGHLSLRVISRCKGEEIVATLHNAGFGATLSQGRGRDGDVGIINSVIPSRQSKKAMALVQQCDPAAFMVADEARAVMQGWLPGATSAFPSLPVTQPGADSLPSEPPAPEPAVPAATERPRPEPTPTYHGRRADEPFWYYPEAAAGG